ncbi:2-succinyl-6-hydroxy-2,4-cyclohexadiene-1-carboxylate synthase [Merismopedia glauca CCAP 1448/3]|uniref:Putative 2-succinyl-6-hydroxy-2,4-cyclohexadiene-1-carboxylate synthase n=1 Tax=Merismopedia glauca CCAP 1448/3 TaxID=1296344 RepID=A0A2T1BYA6_9CYAN|nr:2-succinyl-6-hydroxy-2,4-cyclohexadiene-1-carboxylate synthase [Merismopedia glauca CCAP 1448/3]
MKVDNYHFNYCSIGNSSNLPILFLHGFMGDYQEFYESILLLSNQFYCLAVNLPGHGKTQVIGGEKYYKIEYIAEGLLEFLKSLNIPKCILIGYSMGGRLALYLALHFPTYFSHIILESASPGLKTPEEREDRVQTDLKLAEELENQNLSSFLTKWYNQPLFASIKQNPDFDRMLERRLQNNPQELAKALRNLSTGLQPSLWSKLKSNPIPLLLIVGELDRKFIGINNEMLSLCQVARLEIVSNCGHNVHLEKVDLFGEKIRDFIIFPR